MNKEIKQLNNVTVDKKEEANSKNGAYFKFTIDGQIMSCWDYDMGKDVPVGSVVNVQYTEKDGGKVIYKNITAIVSADAANNIEVEHVNIEEDNKPIEEVKVETVRELQPTNSDDALFNACAQESLNIVGRVYDSHYVKDADVPIKFDARWIEAYGDTLIAVHDKAKEIRKQKLGY